MAVGVCLSFSLPICLCTWLSLPFCSGLHGPGACWPHAWCLLPLSLVFSSQWTWGRSFLGSEAAPHPVADEASPCFPLSPPLCLWQAARMVRAWALGSDSWAQILTSLKPSDPDFSVCAMGSPRWLCRLRR